jgi:hypothetical protein
MIEVITVRDRIRGVARRWGEIYTVPMKILGSPLEDSNEIHKALLALDPETASADDVKAIIGNTAWTDIVCDHCGKSVGAAVWISDNYEDAVTICAAGLEEAVGKLAGR